MSRKDNVDYQLDLTPFISLLSVCICFLLLTVTWFQIGALSMKQVIGNPSLKQSQSKKEESQLWIYMKSKKKIEVRLKKGQNLISQKVIKFSKSNRDFEEFHDYIVSLKKKYSSLTTAFILPEASVIYEDIIKVMDNLRQEGLFDMGLAPL
ncbi:MAG: biopolymer transporter ExbD [Bdellovibrionales bacterium]|nr:biopolymer transporter ExbD [Bdellovibrionales bacterium]